MLFEVQLAGGFARAWLFLKPWPRGHFARWKLHSVSYLSIILSAVQELVLFMVLNFEVVTS